MFTVTAPKFRIAATAIAASILGTALIFATPQAAYAATPADKFARTVEAQLKNDTYALSTASGIATIAVRIAADGRVLSADVAGSTGHAALDRDALLTAKGVSYPKGDRTRTVAMVLRYGNVEQPSATQLAALVTRYVNAKGEALASQSPATPVG